LVTTLQLGRGKKSWSVLDRFPSINRVILPFKEKRQLICITFWGRLEPPPEKERRRMENDTFTGWNSFPGITPSYDFDAIVEFQDGRKWIASWQGDHWDFATPHIFSCEVPIKRWMAFPD